MTRAEIERKAPQEHQMWLLTSSASTVYRYALDRGWITEQEHDQARRDHGASWNYAGD